jgi:L-asparaginase
VEGNERGIRVLVTGGTIDKVYSLDGSLEVGDPAVGRLLEEGRSTLEVTIEPVLRKDSLHFDDADRAAILDAVRRAPESRLIVTHGTDTMAETARMLAAAATGKVVVLTGAMRPASMRVSDAAFNVGVAVAAVQLLEPGIHVAMNGRLFPADEVMKDRSAGLFTRIVSEGSD